MDTSKLLLVAEEAARAAGELLRGHGTAIVSSAGRDIKLEADKAAHDLILKKLSGTNIPVLSEEGDKDFTQESYWLIDPLDGSLNFSRAIPLCAVSIALIQKGEPVLGVIYDFNRGELFSGVVGEHATLNGQPIAVSATAEKAQAVIATGFPSHSDFSDDILKQLVHSLQEYKKVRLLGSAALSLAWVACGRVDAYAEHGIFFWDVAAGLALVKAAGGTCQKSPIDKEGKCTVAAGTTETLTTGL